MAKSNNINAKLQSSDKNKNKSSAAAEAEELTVAPLETEAETQRAGEEEEGDDEGDATISEIVNGTLEKKKKKEKRRRSEKGDEEKGCNCKFPMNRIRRIIKSEGSGVHIAQDSVFLINKAAEKFLELFCKEAYARTTLDKKKHVEYKHLSSVVSKRKRFDFLSDFVPEKIKAGDALAEMSSAET